MFMCDIATASMHPENYKLQRERFYEMAFGKRKRKAFDLRDPRTAHILGSMLHSSIPVNMRAAPVEAAPQPIAPQFKEPRSQRHGD